MTPERTDGARGSFRFDEDIPGIGRLRRKSGARTLTEHRRRVALVRRLRDEKGRLDLLAALHRGDLSIVELLDADRRDALPLVIGDVTARRPLWKAARQVLDGMSAAPATIARYRVSWKQLEVSGALDQDATVADLGHLDWRALERQWAGQSGADWNNLRRAVSRVLTILLGSRWHPLRGQVLSKFPRRPELERVPELSPAEFRAAIAHVVAPMQPVLMTLVITGLRIGELLALTTADLGKGSIVVRRGKTSGSTRRLRVDPSLWTWIERAVPCPFTQGRIRDHWYRALDKAKLSRIRLHDLRHCTAQWLVQAGQPITSLQDVLGHKALTMTMRYARHRALEATAAAMVTILGTNTQVGTQVASKAVAGATRRKAAK